MTGPGGGEGEGSASRALAEPPARPRRAIAVALATTLLVALLIAWLARPDGGDERVVLGVAGARTSLPGTSSTAPPPTGSVPRAATSVPATSVPDASAPGPLPTAAGTTALAPTPSPAPSPAGGARVAADPSGRWALYDTGECLELVQQSARHGRLLCGAKPAARAVGDVVALDTAAGRLVVAVVDPSVTGFHSIPRQAGGFFYESHAGPDRDTPSLAYAAGFAATGATDLLVKSEAHTLARVVVPATNRSYPPGELEVVTAPPYGRWRAYRHAANTGFYFGGQQELGFYLGESRQQCLLYRRFAGSVEGVLADACVAGSGSRHLPVAVLSPVEAPQFESSFVLAALTDLDAVKLVLELPDRARIAVDGLGRHADPSGSGWAALAQFAGHVRIPDGVKRVSFVLLDASGAERARAAVDVPGR